ncbi:hypothetical protein C0Q70_10060 [Pomacea canaliculata]|uniref:Uncharacterized protein n=1 Tax=Pomacea canaliculata TaxID=400727 RepID=A0A2T7PBI7_POMCA|nr:hypothetical protein C0Q70_10060 [Pomacea canaliculata]
MIVVRLASVAGAGKIGQEPRSGRRQSLSTSSQIGGYRKVITPGGMGSCTQEIRNEQGNGGKAEDAQDEKDDLPVVCVCVRAVYPPSETLFHLDVSNHWRLEACLRVTAPVVPPTVYRGLRRPAPSCGPARGRRDYPLRDLLTDGKEGRMEDGFNSHVVLLVVPPRFMTDLCLISTILTTLDKDPFIATRSCKDDPRPLTHTHHHCVNTGLNTSSEQN